MALKKNDGSVTWTRNGEFGAPVYGNGFIFSASPEGLFGFNALGGAQIWAWQRTARLYSSGGPVLYGKNLYLLGADMQSNFVCSIDPKTGSLNWLSNLTQSHSYLAVSGNKLFTFKNNYSEGSPYKYIKMLDNKTGKELDSIPVKATEYGVPRIVTSAE